MCVRPARGPRTPAGRGGGSRHSRRPWNVRPPPAPPPTGRGACVPRRGAEPESQSGASGRQTPAGGRGGGSRRLKATLECPATAGPAPPTEPACHDGERSEKANIRETYRSVRRTPAGRAAAAGDSRRPWYARPPPAPPGPRGLRATTGSGARKSRLLAGLRGVLVLLVVCRPTPRTRGPDAYQRGPRG